MTRPTPVTRPMTDLAFTRALLKMSMPELRALWQAELDGRLDATLPPRERIAAWHRRQKREVFFERRSRCPLLEQARIHQELVKGTDPDEVFNGMSASPIPAQERP